MDNLLRQIGRIPGALMIVPLFLGALVNTAFPETLAIGSSPPRSSRKAQRS